MKHPVRANQRAGFEEGNYDVYMNKLISSKVNALREWWSSRASAVLPRIETQSATGEELRLRTLLPSRKGMISVLRPQGGAFKGEL